MWKSFNMGNVIYKAYQALRGYSYSSYYRLITQNVKQNKVKQLSDRFLQELLLHAYRKVPYYRSKLSDCGVIYSDDKVNLERFKNLPILTKDIIRQEGSNLWASDYKKRKWYSNSSGGSTGEPLHLIQDREYARWVLATNKFFYTEMLGLSWPFARKVVLWGSEREFLTGGYGFRKLLSDKINNTITLNTFKLSKEAMRDYINIINSFKPEVIIGYAMSLYEICFYASNNGLQLHQPKFVVAQAEMLRDDIRKIIEESFRAKVCNFYGSREASAIAGESTQGLMNVFSFNNLIEIVNSQGKPVGHQEEGEILLTNLHNYSMPLIRYAIGDTGVWDDCAEASSGLAVFKHITGRVMDNFVAKDGSIIPGSTLSLTFNLKDWVKNFQIIQEEAGWIRFLVVTKAVPNLQEQEEIEHKFKKLLGNDCRIDWDYVSEIPKTITGKHLFIKSHVRRK